MLIVITVCLDIATKFQLYFTNLIYITSFLVDFLFSSITMNTTMFFLSLYTYKRYEKSFKIVRERTFYFYLWMTIFIVIDLLNSFVLISIKLEKYFYLCTLTKDIRNRLKSKKWCFLQKMFENKSFCFISICK